MLIFILQTIWLYIKELAGKDLEISVIVKFLVYFMPKLIPLVLPLTILLASIMVFGNFAENYEFAAMKSTGISLQRAMSGLSIFIISLGVITFFFSNNVIPWAEVNSYNLRRNIAKLKPAAFIASGQFNQLGEGFNIKVEDKSGDRGQYLEGVTIHQKSENNRATHKTIVSKTGELASDPDSEVLQLILFDGHYYDDVNPKDAKKKKKKPFIKSSFKKYIINIDLTEFNNVDFDEKSQTDKYNMLDIVGLNKTMDSLIEKRQKEHNNFSKNLFQRVNINQYAKRTDVEGNSNDSIYTGPILDVLDTKNKFKLVDLSLKSIVNANQTINQKISSYKVSKAWFNRHIISFHEKFALGFACIILFFVGAPLGALIRKGGIGLPMVIAILLFLTYHFIGIFATNSAKNGDFNPVLASWFSTLIMLPLGIYLTKRATADRGLFEVGNVIEPLKKIFNIKPKDSVDYKFLSSYKRDRLLDVIVNYESLGHDEESRYEALNILNKRGESTKMLRDSGQLSIDNSFDTSEKISTDYKDHSKFAIVLYAIGIVLLVLFFVFRNNKLPSLATASIQLSLVSFVLYIIYYVKSLLNIFGFYNHINKPNKRPRALLIILGFPLYFITYMFLRIKIREDLKQNCLDSLK